MTDNNHPITPSPELVKRWEQDWHYSKVKHVELEDHIATQAARWGADQELEACCEWLDTYVPRYCEWSANFHAARRPKPPSLKEQALEALDSFEGFTGSLDEVDIIRRALESLPS